MAVFTNMDPMHTLWSLTPLLATCLPYMLHGKAKYKNVEGGNNLEQFQTEATQVVLDSKRIKMCVIV